MEENKTSETEAKEEVNYNEKLLEIISEGDFEKLKTLDPKDYKDFITSRSKIPGDLLDPELVIKTEIIDYGLVDEPIGKFINKIYKLIPFVKNRDEKYEKEHVIDFVTYYLDGTAIADEMSFPA